MIVLGVGFFIVVVVVAYMCVFVVVVVVVVYICFFCVVVVACMYFCACGLGLCVCGVSFFISQDTPKVLLGTLGFIFTDIIWGQ